MLTKQHLCVTGGCVSPNRSVALAEVGRGLLPLGALSLPGIQDAGLDGFGA